MQAVINGMSISYLDEGEGTPPVLHLHGWEGDKNSFAPVIAYLKEKGKRVMALDFPGHGESASPPTAWDVTDFAEQLHCFLTEKKIGVCDIIAHSFGARVAIVLAAKHPECCGRMVLTGAAGLIPKRGFSYYWKTYTYKLGKRLGRIAWINRLFSIDEKQKNAGSSEYQRLSGTMRSTYVRVVNQNLRPYLPQIKSSTLLIWGSEDTATPLWMGEIMEKEIPDAGLVIFEGLSHFAYIEDCPRFCVIVDEFLRR